MEKTKRREATIDYRLTCWYCGSRMVTPMLDYVVCNDCGATWNEVIEPGPDAGYHLTDDDGKRTDLPPRNKPFPKMGKAC